MFNGSVRSQWKLVGFVLGCALLALSLYGCSSTSTEDGQGSASQNSAAKDSTAQQDYSAFPVTVTIDPFDAVIIEDRPNRIVSLSPTVTEMLFAVGAGDQVIAVDEFSNFPSNAPTMSGLSGYTPNVESILAYDPDLVLMMSNAEGIANGLESAGVSVVIVDAATDLEQTYAQILSVATMTGHRDVGETVVAEMRSDIDRAIASVSPEVKESGLTYYHELTSDLYSVSDSTFIGEIYSLFGLSSIVAGGEDYPQLSNEAVIAADPDLIFLANSRSEGIDAGEVSARPGWNTTTAVSYGRIINLDDDLASRWGPRVPELVRAIADALNAEFSIVDSEAVDNSESVPVFN